MACDKREDTARVRVPLALLEQWQCAPRQLADAIATLLGLRRPMTDNDPARYDLGVMKGAKHSAHVVLTVGNRLLLAIAGHTFQSPMCWNLGTRAWPWIEAGAAASVDNPVAAAGDEESAAGGASDCWRACARRRPKARAAFSRRWRPKRASPTGA